jgi:hypothetical protein
MMITEDTSALDEAFERLAAAGFELPNGFVNHGAMACEALDVLGHPEVLDDWARRFARAGGAGVTPVTRSDFDWQASLGDRRRLPEWIGAFEREIDTRGWEPVVATWVARLMPALRAALFHGAIRTAHAVRAIGHADTGPRRGELARALGYWASRYAPGEPATPVEVDGSATRRLVVDAAAGAARHYLASPGIVELHGVTGAMAVELLVPHLSAGDAAAGLAQVRAEHRALYGRTESVAQPQPTGTAPLLLADRAAATRDPHKVKLVEACRRGMVSTGDPAFAAAAEVVMGGAAA